MTNKFFDNLGDDLDAVINSPVKPADAKQPPASYAPKSFDEVCPKCRGTGRFVSYSGRVLGECFACKGAGKKTFKSSSADRAKGREQAAVRKVKTATENFDTLALEHPAIAAWLVEKQDSFGFAKSLYEAIIKYGSLTENQRAAVYKILAKDAARKEAAVERKENAPVVDTAGVDRLKAAFDKAQAAAAEKGVAIRTPKITIGTMVIKPAKATSKNPGALYVTDKSVEDGYLGKIADGKFFASRICTDAQRDQILKFVADPAEAAKVYGQETGVCCICNATLISKWRYRGIGPICAEKFGWAGE